VKRMTAAIVAGVAAAGLAAAADGGRQAVFRSRMDLVPLGVTVLDRRNTLITDLRAEEFEIWEDGRRQEIAYFAPCDAQEAEGAAKPELHLGIMLDVSGSMDEDLKTARTAAIKFLDAIPGARDFTVVDFDTEVRAAQFPQEDFPRLVERLRGRKAGGYTALFDAVGVYLDTSSGHQGRKVLVIYSDGSDNSSHITFAETIDLLKSADVTVYTIGFLEHAGSASFDLRAKLQQMAEVTGGYFINPVSMKEIESAYERVRTEIAAQYTLGFVSSNTKTDGAWRKVEIRVVKPGLKDVKIRARKGYFAPYRARGGGPGRLPPAR